MPTHATRRQALKTAGTVLSSSALLAATSGSSVATSSDGSNSGNRTIGGGEGYNRTVPPSEATYMISEAAELRPVLENQATVGDVVYIDPDATLVVSDLGYDYADNIPVPKGVTLASNRGIGGAPGGHIKNEFDTWPIFDIEEGARVTGLRLSGPHWDWFGLDEASAGMGIRALGPNTKVDNCELWGFSHAAVGKGHPSFYGQFSLNVHNNYIHHNSQDGLGYGVSASYGGHAMVEYNLFEHNRHSIASGSTGGYTARFNHVIGDEAISHIFDMHRPGGDWIHIHHNTVEPYENVWPGKDKKAPAVTIRGVPSDEAWIHHNWFYNPEEPLEAPLDPDDWTDEAITQMFVEDWTNVRFHMNHYGSDEPRVPTIGAPR